MNYWCNDEIQDGCINLVYKRPYAYYFKTANIRRFSYNSDYWWYSIYDGTINAKLED